MRFSDLDLHNEAVEGTLAAGFSECMPVQSAVLPVSLSGKDVMVQSKTGSGKTAAFILTFLEKYLRNREKNIVSKCLIIVPTRELAQQIASDAKILCGKTENFTIGCFFGGVGYEPQVKLLKKGCEIYVGTPGRLLDFIGSRQLDCRNIDTFIMDEADRMFDMGFMPDIKKIFSYLPPVTERQTMLFSATLEMRVRELAWEYMNEPVEIELEPEHITVENITQELFHVAKTEKFRLFLQILAKENPESVLVFTNSRFMTETVCRRLKINGYNSDFISGDLSQSARDKALKNIKTGKTRILVATDVAARGLQIDDLPLVVNYDVPEDYENYVHRIGRTARAGDTDMERAISEKGKFDVSDIFKVNTVKYFMDEGISMVEPYPDAFCDASGMPHGSGTKEGLLWNIEHYRESMEKAKKAGYNIHVHCYGDLATRETINSMLNAGKYDPDGKLRNIIAHIFFIHKDDIKRMADAGIIASIQPQWESANEKDSAVLLEMVGEERGKGLYPNGSLVRAGVCCANGSDFTVTMTDALEGISIAMTRKYPKNHKYYETYKDAPVLNPSETVSLKDAIMAWTINVAYQFGREDITGSIEVGKSAELVVLNGDIENTPAEDICLLKVKETLFKGQTTYKA